ncbi:Protein BIG GRAIN 1-like E [Linum grandiflorum]
MSVTGLSPQSSSKLFNNNKPFHHRNSSAELDVFEAANYFSGYYNEVPSHYTITNRVIARGAPAGRRMSLDNGMIQTHQIVIKDNNINNVGSSSTNNVKQHKQPSSPGARLASFLNQLFHQGGTAGSGLKKSKTKKSKSSTKDEDEINANGGGRRKRRSSISNITRSWYYSTSTGTSIVTGTSTCTSSSSSAHLPPQPAANYTLPTKANKGFNQKAVSPLPIESSSGGLMDDKVANYKGARSLNNGCGYGDGYESDSSSDLFELQNYDSDVYSNGGLPVYDTTDVVSTVSASTIS